MNFLDMKKIEHPKYDEEERYFCDVEGQSYEVHFGLSEVPEEWVETLWDIYNESLHIEEAVQEQSCYTRDTFISALSDPEYKKVVLVINGVAAGLLIYTNSVDKARIAYINPDFIRRHFRKEAEDGRFVYILCVCVSPQLRTLGGYKMIVMASLDAIRERNYVLGLDVTDTRYFIPEVLMKIAEEIDYPMEKQELGSQSYYAFPMTSNR